MLFADEIILMPPKGDFITQKELEKINSYGLEFYMDENNIMHFFGSILDNFEKFGA